MAAVKVAFDLAIPELLKIPALCRFISYEPALGPVDFTDITVGAGHVYPLGTNAPGSRNSGHPRIDWIIVGGESGHKARPFNIDWARQTVAQCQAAGVACFVKQLGAVPMMATGAAYRLKPSEIVFSERNQDKVPKGYSAFWLGDKKGGDMAEWPEDLRVREFPIINSSPSTVHVASEARS